MKNFIVIGVEGALVSLVGASVGILIYTALFPHAPGECSTIMGLLSILLLVLCLVKRGGQV